MAKDKEGHGSEGYLGSKEHHGRNNMTYGKMQGFNMEGKKVGPPTLEKLQANVRKGAEDYAKGLEKKYQAEHGWSGNVGKHNGG